MNLKKAYYLVKLTIISLIIGIACLLDVQAKQNDEANIRSAITNALKDHKISALDVFKDGENTYAAVINISTNGRDVKLIGTNVLQKILSLAVKSKLSSVDIAVLGTIENLNFYYNGEDCAIIGKGINEEIPCTNQSTKIPEYTIEKKDCILPHKCSYELRIKNKLTEDELTVIAKKVLSESPAVNSVFITYFLPCMKLGQGAWANAIFNPDLKVTIMDFTLTINPACIK